MWKEVEGVSRGGEGLTEFSSLCVSGGRLLECDCVWPSSSVGDDVGQQSTREKDYTKFLM